MSWFGERIIKRQKSNQSNVDSSLRLLADSLMGNESYHAKSLVNNSTIAEIEKICWYFKVDFPEEIPKAHTIDRMIDYITKPSGIMRRRVTLEGKWWKNSDGPLLAQLKDSEDVIALIPNKMSGYSFFDKKENIYKKITSKNKELFEDRAMCFYRPLPLRKMSGKELLIFLIKNISFSDRLLIMMSSLMIVMFGILTPLVTNIVYSKVIPSGKYILLWSSMLLLLSAAVGTYLVTIVKTTVISRITNRMDTLLQNSVMGRIMNMPVQFFKDKSSGALSQGVGALSMLPTVLTEIFFGTGIMSLMSILYIIQIWIMMPSLLLPALITYIAELVVIFISLIQGTKQASKQLDSESKTQGLVFALFSGIQKIKLSGSEDRAFAKWASLYFNKAQAMFKKPFPSFMLNELIVIIQLIGLLIAYLCSFSAGSSVSDFAVFSTTFGMIMSSIILLAANMNMMCYLKPLLETASPILQEIPETSNGKKIVQQLKGNIELNNISFRYSDDGPKIIDNLSIKIKSGEYVAIVGKSGCGKSTLMRILLGFETPSEGAVYYDNNDLSKLDLASFRSSIGTVMQNGKLFSGDIFSNITISAPWLNMDDAWEAARMAGIGDDIKNMPMGMHTIISEGGGGVSGGQKQRLMIARAIVHKPKILMLDEATSALDNLTQKIVSDSLNNLKCTRIVIAHRLSTIKECDRIIVLDSGKIIEDGTYDELIRKDGFFADLVKRQQVESTPASN